MKSFFLGLVVGCILTFAGLFIVVLVNNDSDDSDLVKYLDSPVSYENKKVTSVKVFQVLDNSALAHEISDERFNFYYGNTVMILGENFYSEQVIKIKNPKRIGTYSYTSNSGKPLTVPVLDGEIIE